jgi:hypothetical protein
MTGMPLGGVDPSIIHELSGVYKPFTKAFKELLSNAFDADADRVIVTVADDFSSVTVEDDGEGMTPFEFRNDFTRIGGGSRRWAGELTRKGRRRIGSKGIGFLAMARYCSGMRVRSMADRRFCGTRQLESTPGKLRATDLLGFSLPRCLLEGRLTCHLLPRPDRRGPRRRTPLRFDPRAAAFIVPRSSGDVAVRYSFDCSNLQFEAELDFDQLLMMADQADLDKLSEFARIDIREVHREGFRKGTTIEIHNLKSFVRRELKSERRKGNVKNIGSQGGFASFLWGLSRCTPVEYASPSGRPLPEVINRTLQHRQPVLSRVEVRHGGKATVLSRPLYPLLENAQPIHDDLVVPVKVDDAGLSAEGFIVGYEGAVFPAEYRGISVRVRGVAIGDPTFFGADKVLTGAQKAALSQMTGEINVLSGLDGPGDINPGRESFYDESDHCRILLRHFVGDGEQVGGSLGQAIAAILRRSQVQSAMKDVRGRAALRRRTLEDVSAGITHLLCGEDEIAATIRTALNTGSPTTNGLAGAVDLDMGPPPRLGGMQVVPAHGLSDPFVLDYEAGKVFVDLARREWDCSLLLFDTRYTVVNKKGRITDVIGEIDFVKRQILINWAHPIRTHMDENIFLRTALAWALAREATGGNASHMMEVALRLLSFRSGGSSG